MTLRLSVFGVGFVGRALLRCAGSGGGSAEGYTRHPVAPAAWPFDAARDLPPRHPGVAVVTMPPMAGSDAFWDALRSRADRIILLGTTGSYAPTGPVIDPSTPVRDDERAPFERAVVEGGGTVLRLAGLYGRSPPTLRHPDTWLAAGRVGPERRFANLVHVDDVAAIVLAVAALAVAGAFPVADGASITWAELAAARAAALGAPIPDPIAATRPDARVDGSAVARRVGLRYRERLAALAALRG